MVDIYDSVKEQLLDAALLHVAFDGWSEATFKAALADTGIDSAVARNTCPRGAVDLAITYHERGDSIMIERLKREDLNAHRFRDKIAAMVRFRLEAAQDKEAVRRGTTLFALPIYAADGVKAIWGTADAIWNALGDSSDDVNWYTKRATLSGVYGATVLFWLGDDSEDHAATWEFLDRRIDNVMQIEKMKASVRKNPVLSRMMAGPNWFAGQIKAPQKRPEMAMPGSWSSPRASQSEL
jgi:ubiquinone biosynthesis protein COQ9